MRNLKEAFGQRLKEIRKSKNYTQETLAEMIDLSPRQLIRIENGQNFPSADTIGKLSLFLGVGLDNLFDFNWNEDMMYFTSGIYNKPTITVVKNGENAFIKQYSESLDKDLISQIPIKLEECEKQILDLCKQNNKTITVEFFENKKRIAIKTFYPDGRIEDILSREDIMKNELYNYILLKLKKISTDSNKLSYIKHAVDSLDDKNELEKLKTLIQGMELVL